MDNSKIINDAVFGFIRLNQGLILDLVKHPALQRLTRIKQLGLTSLIFPSAQHTRFQHSLGAYHLMTEAIQSLRQKGVFIFDSEAEAVCAAILLHDVGHAPFSHVLENTLMQGISHEDISLKIMNEINREKQGQLNLAIRIFQNKYNKNFLHQLISSQLDVDRLDYLSRDSFFCGVTEGNIGSARIIKMLNVVEDNLVVDYKGLFSIENYLSSRRLMYWQVYLHKKTIAAECMLINTLNRAKHLIKAGMPLFASPSLFYFLNNNIDKSYFDSHPEALDQFLLLDDTDIWCALKTWTTSTDRVLSLLSSMLINRQLFEIKESDSPFSELQINVAEQYICDKYNINKDDAKFLYRISAAQNNIYNTKQDKISLLHSDGTITDIAQSSDALNFTSTLSQTTKYYLCFLDT